MDEPRFKRNQVSDAERTRVLDKLDLIELSGQIHPRRGTARLEYRVREIPMSVNHPGGGVGRYIVLGRNLSPGGISLLHTGYLHTGTECRIALGMPRGGAKTLVGRVVFCRHAAGILHEVGVQFTDKIDIAEFLHPEGKRTSDDPELRAAMQPLRGNALLVVTSEAERRLLEARLRQSGLNPTSVDRPGAALDQVKLLPYVVVVVDMNMPDPGPSALVESLIASGYLGTIVGLAADDAPGESLRAVGKGMHGCIMKPVRHESMHRLLSRLIRANGNKVGDDAPIVSTIAGEQGAEELIQFFLAAARDAEASLTGAVQAGDVKSVRRECNTLKSIAGGYGFQSVAEAARQVVWSLDETGSMDDTRPRIAALLNVLSRLSPDKPKGAAGAPIPGAGASTQAA